MPVDVERSLTADRLATTRALVEQTVGRELRPAERAIDVLALNHALQHAKDQIERAVKTEQRLAVLRALRTGQPVRLRLTRDILRPLDDLYKLGRKEAAAELERAGYTPIRQYEHPDRRLRGHHRLFPLRDKLRAGLAGLSVRVDQEMVHLDLGAITATAVAGALLRVPGGRDLASRVISSALYSGMGLVFEENEHLVDGWIYTAIMDQATCDSCEELDGTEYATWAEAQGDLPGGGPSPACFGDGRCRCRLVPQAAG